MTKEYKIEPPEIVRQMWGAGLTVAGRDGLGELRMYYPEDLTGKFIEGRASDYWPPSWIKELEPEQTLASRIKVDAPVEVSLFGDAWWRKHFARFSDEGVFFAWDGGSTSFSTKKVCSWEYWRVPANMDPEEWKREWLVPEEELPEVVNPWPKKRGITGEVER